MHDFHILKYFSDLTALRFQVSILSEDLRIGGFTHRRVSISQLPSSVGMTREQFEYKWMSPKGLPVTPQPSPEMYAQLKSPQQFGLYTIRVRGIHSGYTHELQSEVLLPSNPDDYSLWILDQGRSVLPNSRVEVLCEVRPAHPGAKVRWVNAQNLVVASNNRLLIERFRIDDEGSYFCEAFLPDGNILLKTQGAQMKLLLMVDGPLSESNCWTDAFIILDSHIPTHCPSEPKASEMDVITDC
ncbi:hypothetical protein TSMEX_011461 [Taenia solium]|eukprot:TsM_000733000 transcript=TsM_000733000 gene=TsM_000733000